MTKYNFCAGPAMLPPAVMQKAQKEFIDWQGLGVSVMEISHRSSDFLALTAKCEASLRRLMNISDEFEVLFMHGGGRGQFSAVPLNLHLDDKPAVYCENGVWSKGATSEAAKFTAVKVLMYVMMNSKMVSSLSNQQAAGNYLLMRRTSTIARMKP